MSVWEHAARGGGGICAVPFRIDSLMMRGAFPHEVFDLQLKETPLSWVILTGYFAYKVKKPVHYDFLDTSALAQRRLLCQEELRLNRQLAPDLYLDVVPIVEHDGCLVIGGEGEPVEYAIRMHQFDPSQELAEQLNQYAVVPHDITDFALRLADLHYRSARAPDESAHGSYARVRAQMLDNLTLLRAHLNDAKSVTDLERLAQWTRETLARLQPLIEGRKRTGRIRECHGDLHARNIVRWRQQWLPFDRLEFDPDLRWIDVMSDVAFLFMDFIAYAREDLAYEFLSAYLERTGDYEGLRLLPLYCTYRALVRAKVDALGAEAAAPETAHALAARMTERLSLSLRFMEARLPVIVIMHGVVACGKSWLSERLVSKVHGVRIRSDLERKRLVGMAPSRRRIFEPGEGPYHPAARAQIYDRLLRCTEAAIAGQCSVIVDAAFLQVGQRAMFHALALRTRCRFLIVSCVTDPATLKARLQTRAQTGLDPSEATEAVLEQQLLAQDPLTTEEQSHTVTVDTSWLTSADAGLAAIKERLARAVEY